MHLTTAASLSILMVTAALHAAAAPSGSVRQMISLNGEWLFQRDGTPADTWKKVAVPSAFQDHEGISFHGVGWYRRSIAPMELPAGRRALIHFQAAATEAEVWLNGKRLGSHLGGWTPFRFDITDIVRAAPPGQPLELKVRLDEKVGHNTQGFLPIIAPHFGGLWQEVQLLIVPENWCDDLRILAIGDPETSEIRLEIPLVRTVPAPHGLFVRYRLCGQDKWIEPSVLRTEFSTGPLRAAVKIDGFKRWSPAEPNLYELEIRLGNPGDRILTRAAFRSFDVFGQQLCLNGQPVQLRGLLNWGYSPPLLAPNPGEAVWRQELEFARARGFNMMKFCLWVPPRRYLELADEMGMLTWMEYPTWHPKLTKEFLEPLRREFAEFFQLDRNHPSIVLRSLTCETGHSAQIEVIQGLYDLAKTMVPGAVVEDDSSWIGWNRIHDFYDDHPYGNNHTWVKMLAGFNAHILARGIKPLVLGEAICADSWIDRDALLAKLGDDRPWWAPGPIDVIPKWMDRMRSAAGAGGLDRLSADSLRYGLLMRKYQIEAFRREIPFGGYNVSVIRDIPNATMGLIDYLGRPKWSEADWDWHRDTMCLLHTEKDARSFPAGGSLRGAILLSHFGTRPIAGGELLITLEDASNGKILHRREIKPIAQNVGTLARLVELDWPLPASASPVQMLVRTILRTADGEFRNDWPIWVTPPARPESLAGVRLHGSVSDELALELFGDIPRMLAGEGIVVASRLDETLVRLIEEGGRVLLLPDGQKNSFPLNQHWFLRGAPLIPEHALSAKLPRNLLVELQHFDLAGPVIPDIGYIEAIDPILLLWDTHDLKTVKTHALIFETRAGKGRLMVSALRHTGAENAAGRWLLHLLIDHLRSPTAPKNALPDAAWAYLKNSLNAERISLVPRTWRFHPDPKDAGLAQGWHKPQLENEEGWTDIRIGAAWESQGHPKLDGWAWYRLEVEIPAHWDARDGRDAFLSFEGVDDMYELYVNGELAGKGGDLATRTDAFSEKKSHNITRWIKPGQKATIAIRVHDWYGAGGIFRPVTLGTVGFSPGIEMLK